MNSSVRRSGRHYVPHPPISARTTMHFHLITSSSKERRLCCTIQDKQSAIDRDSVQTEQVLEVPQKHQRGIGGVRLPSNLICIIYGVYISINASMTQSKHSISATPCVNLRYPSNEPFDKRERGQRFAEADSSRCVSRRLRLVRISIALYSRRQMNGVCSCLSN